MAPRTLDIIGGPAVVGKRVKAPVDWISLVRRGLPVRAVQAMVEAGRITAAELDALVIPRKTLANRRKMGTLTPDQSDKLVRVARVIAAAEDTFGDKQKAGAWLRRPTAALAGERPISLLDTDEGSRQVETLLGRINHGIAA